MGATTKIEWTNASWNPITGCGAPGCSEGCANCYARKMATRLRGRGGYPQDDPFKPGTVHPNKWADPIRWRKPRMIFVCSMGDIFHDAVHYQDLLAVLGIIAATPRHVFQLLTKRPENAACHLGKLAAMGESERCIVLHEAVKHAMGYDHPNRPAVNACPWPLPNLWLGVTAENQHRADERIPLLLSVQAAIRFVSVEPMLGPVTLREIQTVDKTVEIDALTGNHGVYRPLSGRSSNHLDWVVCGAETGPGKRPMDNAWARALQHQCTEAEIPFLFKKDSRLKRKINGRTWDQFPKE